MAQHPVDLSPDEARALVAEVPHWHHRIEVAPGVFSPGNYDPQQMLRAMPLPEQMDGLRVLDIGCSDGFFSFECERRGAEVLGIDTAEPRPGFLLAKRLLGSQVEHRRADVYNLSPKSYGQFDIVLFLGVIYHLRHPLLALDLIWTVCRGEVYVETHVIDNAFVLEDGSLSALDPASRQMPIAEFFKDGRLNRDRSNWWAPTLHCLAHWTESALFEVDHAVLWSNERGLVRGRKLSGHEDVVFDGPRFDGWPEWAAAPERELRGE